jgi:hypothetical protein
MDLLLRILLIYLIFFKWYIQSQESSAIVETQYLTYDMAQYGPDGGVFSSIKKNKNIFIHLFILNQF